MTRLIRRWQALPAQEKGLVIEALAYLFWARLIFALLPLTLALRILKARAVIRIGQTKSVSKAEEVRLAIVRASRYAPFKALCLQQAFAGFLMLRRRGMQAAVHFGVRHQTDRSLAAHAWIVSGDTPITGTVSMDDFVPIAVFYA